MNTLLEANEYAALVTCQMGLEDLENEISDYKNLREKLRDAADDARRLHEVDLAETIDAGLRNESIDAKIERRQDGFNIAHDDLLEVA